MSAVTAPVTEARKAEALQLAERVGAAEASRQTGIAAGTIRQWRKRTAGRQADVIERHDDVADVERQKRIIIKARKTAEQALDRLSEVVEGSRDPQRLSISIGVLLDKASMLSAAILELEEREHQIADADAQWLMEVLDHMFELIGVPFTVGVSPVSAVFGTLLRRDAVPLEMAEAAREDVRRAVRLEIEPALRLEIEAEVRARVEREQRDAAVVAEAPLALPPAGGTSVVESEELAAPRRGWVSTPVPAPDRPRLVRASQSGRVLSSGRRHSESDFG